MSSIWKEYFIFSRKERIGIIVVIIIIIFVAFSPLFFSHSHGSIKWIKYDTAMSLALKKLKSKQQNEKSEEDNFSDEEHNNNYSADREENNSPVTLFYFNPNTISPAEWKKLGLRDKTIHTIQNYLSKGGHFHKPEDLKKIYGLRQDEFERLEPYISLPAQTNKFDKQADNEQKQNSPQEYFPAPTTTSTYKKKTIVVDINVADTTAWIELPGIGSKLAARIVNFRDKLGGFYSINQVAETYGVPDSTFQLIKPMLQLGTMQVRKININTATKDELKIHPYIRWNLANAIVEYRNQHGNFSKLEDLQKITIITTELYNKISPYLSL